MAIDPNAMYRAGLARGTTGRNPQVERRVARQENLINLAYTVVGAVANEAVKDGFESLQKFRDLKESQTAAMNLTAKKIPEGNVKGPNGLTLKESIVKINSETRDLNKKIRFSFGKKRAELKAKRTAKQEELHYINSQLTIQQSAVPNSQGMASVATGTSAVDEQEGRVRYSPAAYGEQLKNVGEQANLDLGRLMWYDHDEGVLKVQRGGKWVDDKYVSLSPEENKELKKEYKAYEKDFKSQQLDSSLNLPEGEKAKVLSFEEWAKTQPNKTLRNPKYSELKFARKENKTMTNEDLVASKGFRELGYTGNTLDFEGMKEETYNKIDDYTNPAFMDYFFGGPGYNYSTRTSSTKSLAYQMLLSRNSDTDFSGGLGVDDGDDTNNFIPPGSPPNGRSEAQIAADDLLWEGAITTLKVQDMSSGTDYRKFAQEKMWEKYKGLAEGSQERWKTDNPQTGALTFEQNLKNKKYELDVAKFDQGVQNKIDEQRETQNTVYSIEQEFSDGDNIVGTGTRQAQFMPSKVKTDEYGKVEYDAFGQPKMTESYWSLLEDGAPKGATIKGDYYSPEALDEITKFVTEKDTYTTHRVGTENPNVDVGGLVGPAVYRGKGFWEIVLTAAEKAKGWRVITSDKGVQRIFEPLDESDPRYVKGTKEMIEQKERLK